MAQALWIRRAISTWHFVLFCIVFTTIIDYIARLICGVLFGKPTMENRICRAGYLLAVATTISSGQCADLKKEMTFADMPAEHHLRYVLGGVTIDPAKIDDPENNYTGRAMWVAQLCTSVEKLLEEGRSAQPAYDVLTKHLQTDPFASVRAAAAVCLGKTKMATAIEPLKAALNDKSYLVQINAANSLIELGDDKNTIDLDVLINFSSEIVISKMGEKDLIDAGENPLPFQSMHGKDRLAHLSMVKKRWRKSCIDGLARSSSQIAKNALKILENDQDAEIKAYAKTKNTRGH